VFTARLTHVGMLNVADAGFLRCVVPLSAVIHVVGYFIQGAEYIKLCSVHMHINLLFLNINY
jgi:hypothetical protein